MKKKEASGEKLRIALVQMNPVVGDLRGNADRIIDRLEESRGLGADVVVFPELCLCGYPPEDLLLKSAFLEESRNQLARVRTAAGGILAVVGFPFRRQGRRFNAAAIIHDRKIAGVYQKMCLPNYGVFDEMRYFSPGAAAAVIEGKGLKIGISICEDIWDDRGPWLVESREGGAGILINISASPYHAGKVKEREELLRRRSRAARAFVCYCNLVGGQDELVFDGGSMAFGPDGKMIARAGQFREEILTVDIEPAAAGGRKPVTGRGRPGIKRLLVPFIRRAGKPPRENRKEKPLPPPAEIYSALSLGLKDYVGKNGFQKVVLGLSGGIDSAFVACLAVDALGRENVIAVTMPSPYSSAGTRRDAETIAANLGIKLLRISIAGINAAYLAVLREGFRGTRPDVTEENLQARIRGNLLMAFSNKFGWLVVTTGNKSEMSVGYCTLYGDTAGGFAVIKDVPKMLVYRLSRYVNDRAGRGLIPESVIRRAPTAELKRNQKDQDTLPPYPELDRIIDAYIEKDESLRRMKVRGFSEATMKRVVSMIDRSEYKRRQSPAGVKITPKAFGRDRRMPLTNRFYG